MRSGAIVILGTILFFSAVLSHLPLTGGNTLAAISAEDGTEREKEQEADPDRRQHGNNVIHAVYRKRGLPATRVSPHAHSCQRWAWASALSGKLPVVNSS